MTKRVLRSGAAMAVCGAAIALGALTAGTEAQAPAAGEHLLLVPSGARDVLRGTPSATTLAEYPSFDVVTAEGDAVTRLVRAGASVRDDMRLIRLGSREIDPVTDRAPLVSRGGGGVAADEDGLALVQFVGPIKDEWHAALEKTGVRIVTYQAQNAYLIHGTGEQLNAASAVSGVRALVPYTTADKLDGVSANAGAAKLTVSTLSGRDGSAARTEVASAGPRTGEASTAAGLTSAHAELTGAEARDIAADPGVVAIEPDVTPELHDEATSLIVAGSLNASFAPVFGSGYLPFHDSLGFTASSMSDFVVDDTDSGLDLGQQPVGPTAHPDFFVEGDPAKGTRIAYMHEQSAEPDNRDCIGHGTHTASTIAGYNDGTGAAVEDTGGVLAGYNYGLGVAPRVRIGSTKIFDCSGVFSAGPIQALVSSAYGSGARVSNNSWGSATLGGYTTRARDYDVLVRDAQASVPGNQQMVEVMSAGNSGNPDPPPTAAGSTADGFGTIGAPGTAKNVITVGASEGVRATGAGNCWNDTRADSARDIAIFSSRGPTADGRRKPDIVAPGTHVLSALSGTPGFTGTSVCRVFPTGTKYAESDGTSMAAPQVTGAAALIRDWYRRNHGGQVATPSPALTKAILVNGATDLVGGSDTRGSFAAPNQNAPTADQGWGRVNLSTVFSPGGVTRTFRDQTDLLTDSGTSTTRTFTTNPAEPVRITLAWSDAPGPLVGNAYVNDLDLIVKRGGNTYAGNDLTAGVSNAAGSPDTKNNLENVFLPAGAGDVEVTVRGTTISGDGVPGNTDNTDQDYALVVTNGTTSAEPLVVEDGGPAVADAGDGDGNFEPGERVQVRQGIANVGNAAAPVGITSTLSGALTPIVGSAPYPTLAAGGKSSGSEALEGRIPATASCSGGPVVSTVTVNGGTRPISNSFPLVLGAQGPATTFPKTGAALAIPDGAPGAVVESTLTLPASAGVVRDLDVGLENLTHTWVGDLAVSIKSPAGTEVLLVSRPGGVNNARNNLSGVIFDDEGTDNWLTSLPAGVTNVDVVGGRYVPSAPLSAFDGQDASGVWTLRLQDNGTPDSGTLNDWSLRVSNSECSNPATATADGATEVGTSTAKLGGTVGAGGVPTSYRVDYGPTTAYGSSTPVQDAGDDDGAVSFGEVVGGLSSATEYHYKVVALREGSVVAESGDSTFTTNKLPEAPPPAVGGGGGGGGNPPVVNPPVLGTISFSTTAKTVFATTKRKFTFKFTGTVSKSGKYVVTTKVKKKTVKLASGSFKIDAKGKGSVTASLSKANYKALVKAKKQVVTAELTLDGRTFKRTFTLRPPKPKKKT